MTSIIWWIVGVVFIAPALILLGLFFANKLDKGKPGKAIDILWLVLVIMLVGFLASAIFGGVE